MTATELKALYKVGGGGGDFNQEDWSKIVDFITAGGGGTDIFSVRYAIPFGRIQTLNSLPLVLIAPTGAGTSIEVISAVMTENFVTTAFLSSFIFLRDNSLYDPMNLTAVQFVNENMMGNLLCSANKISTTLVKTDGGNNINVLENTPVMIQTNIDSFDPMIPDFVGDGNIVIYAIYRIITL